MTENATAQVRRITVGCRMPSDHVDLLDAVTKRRGDPDRATTIRIAIERIIEEHFPGSTKEAA